MRLGQWKNTLAPAIYHYWRVVVLSCPLSYVERYHLDMGHLLDGVAYTFSANAAFFHAAVRHVISTEGGDIIDDHAAKIQALDRPPGLLHVTAEHTGLQTISGVVGLVEGFVEVVKRPDGIDAEAPCLVGLRDRALIALMVYTFARIGAVTGLKVEAYFEEQKQKVENLEKRVKRLEDALAV